MLLLVGGFSNSEINLPRCGIVWNRKIFSTKISDKCIIPFNLELNQLKLFSSLGNYSAYLLTIYEKG